MIDEFLNPINSLAVGNNFTSPTPLLQTWVPPELGVLKVNTGVTYTSGKIGICILIWTHLGIPLWAKSIPCKMCWVLAMERLFVQLKDMLLIFLLRKFVD